MAMKSDEKTEAEPKLPLKEACVLKAIEAIHDKGLEGLSLRDVARRLNVSHQAPYKHFATKDHLLAEVIRRCLREFAKVLRSSGRNEAGEALPPSEAMRALGRTYLSYAASHPLEYRLMFMTPWPEEARDAGLKADARAAFDVLGDRLSGISSYQSAEERDRDAMFIWSSIHGIASVLESEAMRYLSFSETQAEAAVAHSMTMMDRALGNINTAG